MKMPFRPSRPTGFVHFTCGLALAAISLFLFAQPAQASWSMMWVCTGNFHSESWNATNTTTFTQVTPLEGPQASPNFPFPPGVSPSSGVPLPPRQVPSVQQTATFIAVCSWNAGDNWRISAPAVPLQGPSGKCMAKFSLHSEYTWTPDTPNEGPPATLYVVEFGGVGLGLTYYGLPAPVTQVTANAVGQVDDTDPIGNQPYLGDWGGGTSPGYAPPQFYSVLKIAAIPTNGATVVEGPVHRFDIELTTNPPPFTGTDNFCGGTVACNMESHVLNFGLYTRRVGSNDALANTAGLAAGGVDSSEHKAEVWLRPNIVDGRSGQAGYEPNVVFPLPQALLPKVIIQNGQGKSVDAKFVPSDGSILGPGDSCQLLGTYTSSDTTSNETGNWPYVWAVNLTAALNSGADPSASISQYWDNADTWLASDGQNYGGTFTWDTPVGLTFLPQFEPDQNRWVPITNHKMNFYISDAEVADYDPETGSLVLNNYSNDKIYMATHSGLLAMPAEGGFPSFQSQAVTDSGGGTYTGTLTVPSPKLVPGQMTHVTISVLPTAEDQNANHPE